MLVNCGVTERLVASQEEFSHFSHMYSNLYCPLQYCYEEAKRKCQCK
jgi:hypothetical protein